MTVSGVSLAASIVLAYAAHMERTQGSPFDDTPKLSRKCVLFRTMAVIALIVFFISCLVTTYHDGRDNALSRLSPAAYNSGHTTSSEISEFYARRSNFCAVCGTCKYGDDGEEDYEYLPMKIDGESIFICRDCGANEPHDISVNGVAYTVFPSSGSYYNTRKFLSERSNFCEVCGACRYTYDYGEWSETDGHTETIKGVKLWFCDDCMYLDSVDVCVDGVVYTLYRD